MNEKLIEISELQNKLKELMTDYVSRTEQIKQDNKDRIETYYSQIMSFIAEHFKPYERFYKAYCNKDHDIATVWVQPFAGGHWVYLQSNSDWTSFQFVCNYYRRREIVGKECIVLGWQKIKEDFLSGLENHKNEYLEIIENSRKSEEELSRKLDDFQI